MNLNKVLPLTELVLLFLLLSLGKVNAQVMKERRVYYLDVTQSMRGYQGTPNIWKEVTSNLKNAINQINDETTEIMVIPFTSMDHPFSPMGGRYFRATDSDKKELCGLIDKQETFLHYTHIQSTFQDYYLHRIDPNKVNYFFLMTDGANSGGESAVLYEIRKWNSITSNGQKNIYGFYVNLTDNAKSASIKKEIDKQNHLWVVNTANVNINLVRVQPKAVYNAKNDKYFDLEVYGLPQGVTISAQFPQGTPYTVSKTELLQSGKARVYVNYNCAQSSLPVLLNTKLSLCLKNKGNFDFLVTETVDIKCEYKPERSLKVSVR